MREINSIIRTSNKIYSVPFFIADFSLLSWKLDNVAFIEGFYINIKLK